MPRRAQAPKAPEGLPYGARKELIEAQRAMPLPQAAPPPTPGAAGAGAATAPAVPAPPPPDPMADARGMAMPPPLPLDAPTARPFEPVTAGLVQGPGPGPNLRRQAEARSAQVAMVWQRIADATGDPIAAKLAQAAAAGAL